MKSILKIFLFIFAMVITVGETKSSIVVNILGQKTNSQHLNGGRVVGNDRVNAFVSTASMAMPSAAVSGASKVAPVANIAAKTGTSTPSFIVSKGGTAFPVPKGAIGPIGVQSGKGIQYIGGSGGNGLSTKVSGFRFMDPVTTGKYPYPGGYGSYFNSAGQTINPLTGQTIAPSNPWWHIIAK